MNKTRSARRMHKMLIAVAALTLVLGVAIGGTVAWLVASSEVVTNTFTHGDITIYVDEANVLGGERTREGNEYTIHPGATVAKDPTVWVEAGSEACYVYACIENTVKVNGTPVINFVVNDAWEKVAEQGDKTLYVYVGTGDTALAVDASAATDDVELPALFDEFEVDGELVTEQNIAAVCEETISVKAYAHQSTDLDNLTTAENAAKAVLFADWN